MKAARLEFAARPGKSRNSVSYLTALIESTPHPIWAVDLDCRLTIFNTAFADAVLQLHNVKVEVGMTPPELAPLGKAIRWAPFYERALREGSFRTEYEMGDGRWMELALNPMVEDGETIGVSVLARDITTRKLADEMRRVSEARFRTVIDKAPIGIVIHRDRINLYANQKWLEMHGLTDDAEVVGRPVEKWLAPAGRWLAQERARMRAHGIPVPDEYENTSLRADGTEFPVQVVSADVHLEDGPARLVFLADISRRKAAEDALRESEERFRSYFELPLVGMALTSPEKDFLVVNDRICEILGYSREELTRLSWAEITHPEDLEADVAQFTCLLAGEIEAYSLDKRFTRKDGKTVWTATSIGCVRKPDGAMEAICVMRDITARKTAESELKEHLREVKLLSEMNMSLLRAESENQLLEDYCRIIVEHGGYAMAWVGFPQRGDEKLIEPAASVGDAAGYLEKASISWAEAERGNGPVGRAIRTGQVQYSDDVSTDSSMAPWRDAALAAGYRSIIAVPFRQSGNDWACLTVYGPKPMLWTEGERRLMEQVASALGFGIETLRTAMARDRYQHDLYASLEQTIQVIADTVDQRDPYTAGHQRRVASLCTHVARKLGLDEDRVRGLRLGATIHDLGKIGIPAEILAKPGKLTPLQYSLVKEHVQLGYDILKDVHFPWPIADMVHQHHERMDGSGYPQGLMGDAILPESRILMVADVLEAMATHRPYRAARGVDMALEEVVSGRGSKFDPVVVDACVALFREDGYQLPD